MNSSFPKTLKMATCMRHIHYKKYNLCCSLFNRYSGHCHRFLTSDISTKDVSITDVTENFNSDIEGLVNKMLGRALERDRMVAMVPKSDLSKHVRTLLNSGFTEADILHVSQYPLLVKNLSQVVDVVDILLEYGLKKEDITYVLDKHPNIIHKTKKEILLKIQMLQNEGLGIDTIMRMIGKQPALLDEDLSGLPQRIEDLKYLFKTKDTFRLLEKSPVLLYCHFDYIRERFNYVFTEMGISQPQMRYSALFSYSMEHIHARHMFLVRAGFFKKLKKKEGQRDFNPKLDQILDTSDEVFVKTFGNMSLTDYETFKKLLAKDRVVLKEVEDYTDD